MSTAVPGYLTPQHLVQLRPVERTDSYGSTVQDYGPGSTSTPVDGWLEQNSRTRKRSDGRDEQVQGWLLVTNHQDCQSFDRYQWAGPGGIVIFETDGPPNPVYTPRGFHHFEVALTIVTG